MNNHFQGKPRGIPFYYAPIPRYFLTSEWVKNPKVAIFLLVAFGRCQAVPRTVHHDGKEINLPAFAFIYGRRSFAEETGLTEDELRTIVKNFKKARLLESLPNKTPKRFTIFRWAVERFSHNSPQQIPQLCPRQLPKPAPQRRVHNKEKKEKYQKDSRPQPSNRTRIYHPSQGEES